MLGLNSIHVSKRGHRRNANWFVVLGFVLDITTLFVGIFTRFPDGYFKWPNAYIVTLKDIGNIH